MKLPRLFYGSGSSLAFSSRPAADGASVQCEAFLVRIVEAAGQPEESRAGSIRGPRWRRLAWPRACCGRLRARFGNRARKWRRSRKSLSRCVRLGEGRSLPAPRGSPGSCRSPFAAVAPGMFPAGQGSFEWISTPALYNDAAESDGALYVAGPAGVFEYDAQGSLRRQYRVGQELPPAPPTAVAVGLSTGNARPGPLRRRPPARGC